MPGGRRWIVRVEAAADRAARLPAVAGGREPECSLEQRPARVRLGREGAHAVEALQRELGGDLRVAGDERRVRRLDDGELEPEPFRVLEPEPVALAPRRDPLVREARGPEVERLLRGDPEGDRVHHPGAGPAAAGARILEERDVGAGAALLVGVEEVIDGRVVLVDSLLDESQSEHAGVEVDVAGCVAGDAGHVMNAFEAHRSLLVCCVVAPPRMRSQRLTRFGATPRRFVAQRPPARVLHGRRLRETGGQSHDPRYLLCQVIYLQMQTSPVNSPESDPFAPAQLAAWRGMLRVHSALVRDLDAELRAAHGLSLHEYEVLLVLSDSPGGRLRMSDLAGAVLLSQSGLTRLVDRLVRAGSVERTRCEEDRRGHYAELTSAGRARFEAARSGAPGGRAGALPRPARRGRPAGARRRLGAGASRRDRRVNTIPP